MAFERGIPNFLHWLLGSPTSSLLVPASWGFLFGTLAICLLLFLIVPFVCFVILSLQYGPSEAFYYVARSVFTAVTEDLPRFSPRRTLAVARLAVQEAIRNKILVGFGIFLLLLLIAGMFLDTGSRDPVYNPARVYLSFVLWSTNCLVILMALLLSAFSLPNDIKNRTIYTVVTKPIRASEIVIGRTLGFAAVGTAMLLAMGAISYLFVTWSLSHDHAVDVASVSDETGKDGKIIRRTGETTIDQHHSHTFEVDANGKGRTNTIRGHWHEVTRSEDGKYRIGPPQGHLIARAPIYGQLVVFDRDGKPGKGINVGNEWEYRGYIEGGTPGVQTKAHAIWTFSGVTKEKYPNGLPLELNLRVFRTFKGDIERGVLGELVIRNPNPDAPVKRSGPIVFESKEFVSDRRVIPVELNSEIGGAAGAGKISLFDDLVDGGEVQVELRCVEPAQYFGVAEPDLYLRPGDAPFELNFAKAYLSIWLQMLLVTGFGVTFSTFLSGPVALMASISAIVLGFFGQFVRDIATGAAYGGGPIESFIRIITQQNVMTDMEINKILLTIIKGADGLLMHLLQAATYILPDYTQFDTTEFVASGYNIFGALVGQQLVMAFVYFTAVSIAGYFFLKTREIAA
jgi:ABC-type transport system involved in multi-copper enzyme maturation permease subunit